jgi:hypothetical protein
VATYIEWNGGGFEDAFLRAVNNGVTGAAMIFRRSMNTVLLQTGDSSGGKKPSPPGSSIPFTDSGALANRWHAQMAKREGSRSVARVVTNVEYAFWLVMKGRAGEPGGRDYLRESLPWRQDVNKDITKRLQPKRLVNEALRLMKKGGFRRKVE